MKYVFKYPIRLIWAFIISLGYLIFLSVWTIWQLIYEFRLTSQLKEAWLDWIYYKNVFDDVNYDYREYKTYKTPFHWALNLY